MMDLLRVFRPYTMRAALGLLLPLGAWELAACGSTSSHAAPGGNAGASGPDGGGADDGAVGATGDAEADGGGGGVVIFPQQDSGPAVDANACSQLNIGILGMPGSNPSSNFQTWLVESGTSVASIQTTATDPLTAAELAPFDVVILNWLQRDYTPAEAAIFAAWVQAGGGVVSMSGFDNDTTVDFHANSLLAPLQVAYADPFFDSVGPVTLFATHPITAGLTSVTFLGGYAVDDLGGTASTRTPIAFLPYAGDDGGQAPVGYAVTMGAGHAFVWGDEWIQYDSEWSTIPQIKQLWVQVFGWIAPPTKCSIVPPK